MVTTTTLSAGHVSIPADARGREGDVDFGTAGGEPSNWTAGALPTNFRELHLEQSPETPYAIPEFQGGAIAYWGGSWDLDQCAAFIGAEAERVFYKNNFGFGIQIFNLYMVCSSPRVHASRCNAYTDSLTLSLQTYGGTNWGNLGQPGAYTSYDYGAAIKEDRTLFREKYAEAKLIAQFIKASPAYLTATPGNLTNTSYVSTPELSTTPILGNVTNFYVTRHTDYTSLDATPYTLTVPTSAGSVTIPQLGGTLTLSGRDTKVQVTDYDVGGHNLIYSSSDVYTHGLASGERRVLLLYGLAGETHELAFASSLGEPTVEGDSSTVKVETVGATVVVQWNVTEERKVLHYGTNLDVYLLWRNDAFNYWVLELEAASPTSNYTSQTKDTVIAKAGYLLRTATKTGTSLYLTGDLNATSTLEVIAGLPDSDSIYFNGAIVPGAESADGRLTATLSYAPPTIALPDVSTLDWRYLDSLPELQATYDDSHWTAADHPNTTNNVHDDSGNVFVLQTPTSLLAGDYGYHTGSLLYRGHFVTAGNNESSSSSSLYLSIQGGSGFGHSVWLDGVHLGSFTGAGTPGAVNVTLPLPASALGATTSHVITVLIDHMGEETNWTPGYDMMKTPRGILDYALLLGAGSSSIGTPGASNSSSSITWRVTGNLGGEAYADRTRGPLNEGALYAERAGYHLPAPPSGAWPARSPVADGVEGVGVGFFAASFELDVPQGWDVPMSFVFANGTTTNNGTTSAAPANYRVQLFVNGYQFGKYSECLSPPPPFLSPLTLLCPPPPLPSLIFILFCFTDLTCLFALQSTTSARRRASPSRRASSTTAAPTTSRSRSGRRRRAAPSWAACSSWPTP